MSTTYSNHEEADTKLILHAIDAAVNGATQINIHSPDTDVFVLSIRRYPQLCKETYFVTGTGQRRRKISLRPIYEALGPNKAAALPAFHAFSGADNTGSFSGKGKLTCWKAFNTFKDEVIQAFIKLGMREYPDEDTMKGLEEYVCKLYDLKTSITSVSKLRWHLFKKKQAQSDRLPPTYSSLREAILRAHYQSMVWENDNCPNPVLPSPGTYGWIDDEGQWMPIMTEMPPAPKAIIQLVKCGCTKQRCSSNRCQCKKAGLPCTELCDFKEDDDSEEESDEEDEIDLDE